MGNRIIITVQHTQSVHHTNGHAGAWGDWDLTAAGCEQAGKIGLFLKAEGCGEGWLMISSDLKRAAQTAEEIGKVILLEPEFDPVIREVNAGSGNGKPWDWFDSLRQGGCLRHPGMDWLCRHQWIGRLVLQRDGIANTKIVPMLENLLSFLLILQHIVAK